MNTRTVWWLTFLALIKNFSCNQNPFVLEKQELTATEGSCIEIKCKNTDEDKSYYDDDGWFWMKDSKWIEENKEFDGIIVYSKHEQRSVSPLFTDRVQYIVDPSRKKPEKLCHILICDLKKADSGSYSFRIKKGDIIWKTEPETNLTVVENPCPITFQEPSAVVENEQVTLTCSTSSSCPSHLTIERPDSTALSEPPITLTSPRTSDDVTRSITYAFNPSWMHNGIKFSCQTSENEDKYLTKNVTLTVEYAPRSVRAVQSPENVKEGDHVTLTCSAEASSNITFNWFKNNEKLKFFENEMKLMSAKDSDSGLYFCEAENKHGKRSSNILHIAVLYKPEVYIGETPMTIKEGDWISLKCNVKRGQPSPRRFVWVKDGKDFGNSQTCDFKSIKPSDSGNYSCTATNSVGSGTSSSFQLKVQYKPRSTSVSIDGTDDYDEVSVNSLITFTCHTSAYPGPWYSWFRYNQADPSRITHISDHMKFSVKSVQRVDEACYTCNASNSIGEGETSQPKCIRVRFPPTNLTLCMESKVTENSSVTITCSAESFPPSAFTLKRLNIMSSEWEVISKSQPSSNQNTFSHSFTATPAHHGSYICNASNSESTAGSKEKILIVEYCPINVTVSPSPELVVKENDSFSLNCSSRSNPPPTLFTWIKDGDNQLKKLTQSYFVASASPSDSGRYSCRAKNEIGEGKSPQIEVKVKYAPKNTTIIKDREVQRSDGKRLVRLTCKSNGFPPSQYSWHTKTKISDHQTITVLSDNAEKHYCVATNEMGNKSSEAIMPFGKSVHKIMPLVLFICFVFIITLIFILMRKRTVQRGTANKWTYGSFLAWWTKSRRRDPVDDIGLVGPFRSRDDLLTGQPCHLNPQPHQTRPDVTSASNTNTIYSTVNLPHRKEASSAQKPAAQQDDSLNYASLHYLNKQKKTEVDTIYSQVSKPKPSTEKEEGPPGDYVNVPAIHAACTSNVYKSDTDTETDSDTSEDEEDVSYTQVNIRQQMARRNSSSSEDETEYSQVKL